MEYIKEAVALLADSANPTEQEVYAGRIAEQTDLSKTAVMAQLSSASKKAGARRQSARRKVLLHSVVMDTIKVPYQAGGQQALGVAAAEQKLMAAILREPAYLETVAASLKPEQMVLPEMRQIYEAMLKCRAEGAAVSLTALSERADEKAVNELTRFAAQYSDVSCTPQDVQLYLDRIARGTPMAGRAAGMSDEALNSYIQSIREKKGAIIAEE